MPTLAMKLWDDIPTIEVTIQGRRCHFIVDTGAGLTVLNPGVVTKIFTCVGYGEAYGIGRQDIRQYKGTFRIFGKTLPFIYESLVCPDTHITGLFGNDLLGQFSVVEFDYGKRLLRLKP